MSLLMEALRKAEEAKRKSQEGLAPQATEPQAGSTASDYQADSKQNSAPMFTLEPLEIIPTLSAETPGPDLSTSMHMESHTAAVHQDELHEYFTNEADDEHQHVAEPPTPRGRFQTRDQQAAASIFAAKQVAPKKKTHIKVLLASALTFIVIGTAAWWYLSNLSSSNSNFNPELANYDVSKRGFLDEQQTTATSVSEPVPVPDQTALPASSTLAENLAEPDNLPVEAALENTTASTPTAALVATANATDADTTTAADTDIAAPAAIALAANATQAPVGSEESTAAASNSVLQISRTSASKTINASLQSAYNILRSGDYASAVMQYQQALGELPNNRDALIGLASAYTRMGELATARQYYVRLLKLNPQDPYARTGLLQTTQNTGNSAYESDLKALLSAYPDIAPLHFAMGNYYAASLRWSEAQSSYFNALVNANRSNTGPVSPDYAFNLAVSLEQLQQPKAALNYYRQAQKLAEASTPGFDPALLRSRLAYLEQNQQ